ncbi:hypothetical protein JCGZ_13677 [Jatropha curcas]|uniref:Uncharacterized protein n=1 Tax=Jatropha curcas TaxID=180498 RepID=A0A067KLL1_JATCU|nr:hypothetical protein JCGZ_13677 [Jatropha curcas]
MKKEREKLAIDDGEDWSRLVMTRSPENQWREEEERGGGAPLPLKKNEERRGREEEKEDKSVSRLFRFDSNRFGLIQ